MNQTGRQSETASDSARALFDEYLPRIMQCRLEDLVIETPVQEMPGLSERLRLRVLVKREDLQPVFSFKLRGAYAKLQSLSAAERARGVICASAGNHAQGVALAARHLGIDAVVVMPNITPEIKVEAVRKLGATVLIEGDNFDEACAIALNMAGDQGRMFIHPYDDPQVIVGQGTIALELFRQNHRPIDYLFVCVGGGGLASGMALVSKYLHPGIKVIGVEAAESASMKAAFAAAGRDHHGRQRRDLRGGAGRIRRHPRHRRTRRGSGHRGPQEVLHGAAGLRG